MYSHRFLALLIVFVTQINWASAVPLKVGVILPLSGQIASYGAVARNGFELARRENPDKFKGIEFYYEDSIYDGKTSISAFRKLVEQDKVNILFVWGVIPAEVIAPLAKSSKIPTILYTFDRTIHENNPWIVRTKSTNEQFGKKLSDHLIKQGLKRLAIFKVDASFSTAMYEGFKAGAIQNGQSIVSLVSFSPEEMDFRSAITKLRNLNVDAVGIYLFAGQIAQFHRRLSEQKVTLPTFGTEDIGTKSEIEKAPTQMEGAVFSINVVAPSFKESFIKNYEDDSNIWHAAQTYDIANFLTVIPKDSSPMQIMDTFRTAPLHAGALGMPEREAVADGGISLTYPVVVGKIENAHIVELR